MTWSELERSIVAGDASGCIALLAKLTEPERRALAPDAMQAYRQANGERDPRNPVWQARRSAAFLAMLGTATLAEIKKAPPTWREAGAYDVLATRRPPWLQDWCEWILSGQGWAWSVVRRMVREGLCQRPASDMYYLRMLEACGFTAPKQFLLDDPGLLEFEIWELFRIEGNSQLSLSGIEKYGHKGIWARTFVELAAEGRISRTRLLDRSLDALDCDFHQFRAGWFSRFHEALEPTLEERAARSGRYLRLIASRIPPTVSLALNAIQVLCRADLVSPADVLAALPAAFYAREKSSVTLALRLLEHCVRADPRLGPAAAGAALPALEHASAGVQEAALDFISSHRTNEDTALVERIRVAASSAAPSVREKIVSICGVDGSSESPRLEAHRSSTKEPLAPILTIEELALEFSKAIENEGPPDNLERVLDGVFRLCAIRPPDFGRLTAPLAKRAEHFLQGSTRPCFAGYGVRPLFCGLAKAWLKGEAPPASTEPAPGLAGFLGARVREVAARAAAGAARPLLAAPTHWGGSIHPAALLERMHGIEEPDPLDLIQALLRLDRQGRAEALESARALKGEAGEAIRYALGSSGAQAGSSAALWIAASRARNPEHDDVRVEFAWHRHDNNYHEIRIRTEPPIPARVAVDLPTVRAYTTRCETAALLRWTATVWPGYREGWFTAGCRAVGNNLDWWSASWENRVFLEPLLDSAEPLRKMGLILISLGLAAKEAGEGTLAADVLAAAVTDGRMTAELGGEMLAPLFSWEHIKMARVVARLGQVARLSPLHQSVIREGIAAGLAVTPPPQPAALGAVLDLLYELSIATKSPPPQGKLRQLLTALGGGNRAAVAARKLLSLRE